MVDFNRQQGSKPGRRFSRRTRTIISGTGVGVASIYAIAHHFDVKLSELNQALLTILLLLVGIMLLAALTVATVKGLGFVLRRLFGKRQDAINPAEPPPEA